MITQNSPRVLSISRPLFLLLSAGTVASITATATPIISSAHREVSASATLGPLSDSDASSGPVSGAYDGHASAGLHYGLSGSLGDAAQDSSIESSGFSYSATLEASGRYYELEPGYDSGSGQATSDFAVTYLLDQAYSYELSITFSGSEGFHSILAPDFGLDVQGIGEFSFSSSGILNEGLHGFSIFENLWALVVDHPNSRDSVSTVTLLLSPVNVPDTGSSLVLFSIAFLCLYRFGK